MSKKKREINQALPMYHDGDFWCGISNYQTYMDVLNGDKVIPEKCTSVRIPKSVFISLIQSQDLLVAEEEGLLGRFPCKVGTTVYWRHIFLGDGEPSDIREGVVKSFIVDDSGLLLSVVPKEGIHGITTNCCTGPIGRSDKHNTLISLTSEDLELLIAEMERDCDGQDNEEANNEHE